MTQAATIRVDKWLWQARFFKSRSIASALVSAGKVRVDGEPARKPSRNVGPGNVLTFAQGRQIRVVRILDCGTRRGPATEAQSLYEDLSPAPETHVSPDGPKPEKGRPDRKARQNRDAFLRDMSSGALAPPRSLK